MKKSFEPDYRNIEAAARNRAPARLPLYEHSISVVLMEKLMNRRFAALADGNAADKEEYFRSYCGFFARYGYDCPSFEGCITSILPDAGALYGHAEGAIKDMADFRRYPWDELTDRYFDRFTADFEALAKVLPAGMKAIGGVGNGVFETVQDLVGYMNLCFISADDPELYAALFARVGRLMSDIWNRFLTMPYSQAFCVMRMGDDLGYKNNSLLSVEDIKTHVIPAYRPVIAAVHSHGRPFLLHSCGCIFNVMDDLIGAGIDAKHSNEDEIAPFNVWVERYGERIGNFGGIDTDAVCRLDSARMEQYITQLLSKCEGHGGFAFSSGNSIPDYVPAENFVNMTRIVRRARGDDPDCIA